MNIKKAASALNQNHKQIKKAFTGAEVTFAAVEKNLGRAQFLLKLTNHKTATGTPRGLFTSGTMRISPGQIVIVEGDPKIGLEIVARLDTLSDAKKFVRIGFMPADVLAAAINVGSLNTITEEDDIFDYSAAATDSNTESMGKSSADRKKNESMSAARALAGRLGMHDEVEDEIDVDKI